LDENNGGLDGLRKGRGPGTLRPWATDGIPNNIAAGLEVYKMGRTRSARGGQNGGTSILF